MEHNQLARCRDLYGSRRWVFSILAIIMLPDLVDNHLGGLFVAFGFWESMPYTAVTVGLAGLVFSGALTGNRIYHTIILVVSVAPAFLLMLGAGGRSTW